MKTPKTSSIVQSLFATTLLVVAPSAVSGCNSTSASDLTTATAATTTTVVPTSTTPTIINSALTLTPSTSTVEEGALLTLSVTGGNGIYSFLVVSGTGTIDGSGNFTAPMVAETDEIEVFDSIGDSPAFATITVVATSATPTPTPTSTSSPYTLTISPPSSTVLYAGTVQFAAAGGTAPYYYKVTSGTGTIDDSGKFTAPSMAETDTITVYDDSGLKASASVYVVTAYPLASVETNNQLVVNEKVSGKIVNKWSVNNLIDGSATSCYSSKQYARSATSGKDYVAALLSAQTSISNIFLTARMSGKKVLAFPKKYELYVTSPDNTSWIDLGAFTTQPDVATGLVSIPLSQAYLTWGVDIMPLDTGVDSNGNHYFQLCGIQLTQ
jgi:hypothetical protein